VSIIRDYRENGIPIGNRLKFDPKDRPLVYKDIPMVDREVDDQNQLTKRLDDLSRIGQILASPAGQKYLSNESLLFASKVKPSKKRKTGVGKALSVLSQGLFNAARIVGSTLAQVPVNGTGTHFVKAFAGRGKGTYLHELGYSRVIPHVSANGADIVSALFPPNNILPDANTVAGAADIELVKNDNSILFSAESSNLSPKRTKDRILEFEATKQTSQEGIGEYRYKEDTGDNPDTEDVVEKSGQVLNITNAVKEGKDGKVKTQNYANTDLSPGFEKKVVDEKETDELKEESLPETSFNKLSKNNPSEGFRTDIGKKDRKKFNISQRIGLGSPGDNPGSIISQDKINILAPKSKKLTGLEAEEGRDLIKFRFQIITPGEGKEGPKIKHLYFRALIDNFGDTFNANWNSYNYIGRGESFYTYGNFDRSIDLGFKIAAQTRAEMKPLYQKLNYLIGSTTPTYSQNFMRGTFIKMTVGDYIYELPGFLNNVNVSWNQEYPWEIAMSSPEDSEAGIQNINQELPMILDVGLSFTPIHTFLPEAGGLIEGDDKNPIIKAKPFITHGTTTANTYITDPDIKDPNATNTN